MTYLRNNFRRIKTQRITNGEEDIFYCLQRFNCLWVIPIEIRRYLSL
jgi:hypothetical protein